MKRYNSLCLLATVAGLALSASAAQAQTLIPFSPGQSAPSSGAPGTGNASSVTTGNVWSLLGTGATSIQNVLRQECAQIGDNNPAWPAAPGAVPPDLQPYFQCTYEEEGSGFGRQQWVSLANQWVASGTPNGRFVPVATSGGTGHVQFAFADSSATQGDLATYATNVQSTGGAAIMFPKYILPVALAYNPVYGVSGGTQYRFNVNTPRVINGVSVGGMPLSRELYCGIFNGKITNFNDTRFDTANGGVKLRDSADPLARWNADGVPIRIVGRLDRSGTTDIFTRALAAQCNGFGYTNKYIRNLNNANAETLPYNRTLPAANLPDYAPVLSATGLSPTSTAPEAGDSTGTAAEQVVGNRYWNGTAFASVSGGLSSDPIGNQGSGRYYIANGSGGVRDAINFGPDITVGSIQVNGKIGYIGSDYIANSPTGSATLFAAALQENATSGTYNVPEGMFGQAAVSAINPPQSLATGAYSATDTRQVRNPTGPGTVNANRANPLAWYDVLYPTPTTGLANPASGYPIVGTTQFLGYTCYTQRNREHIVNLLGWETGILTQDSSGTNRGSPNPVQNIITASNLGTLPTNWARAVNQTFLLDSNEMSSGRLGSRNLWIQSTAIPGGSANPTCTGTGM